MIESDENWCCEVRYGFVENREENHNIGQFTWEMWDRLGVQGNYIGTLEQMVSRLQIHRTNTGQAGDVQYRVRNMLTQEIIPGEAL